MNDAPILAELVREQEEGFHTHLFRLDQGSPDARPHALTMLGANEAPAAVRLEAGNVYPLPCGRRLHGVRVRAIPVP